jgi:hypothetical protein
MADPIRPLEALRDIHMPAGGDAAVPVVAMILVGCALAVALSLGLWPMFRRWRAVRRSALGALALTRVLEPAERLAAQAVLLRRLVRTIDGDAAARLQGRAWLDHLDRQFATRFFTEGAGRAFGEALYRPLSGQDVDRDIIDRGIIDRDIGALDASLARLIGRISR